MLNKDSKGKLQDDENECHKMKFLDNLFDSNANYSSNDSTFDRTYIKLEDQNQTPVDSTSDDRMMRKINKVFGLKTWVGMFLSFFFLCYVFNFRFILVVPLLFITLTIYAVMTLGHKYSYHYIKKIRSYVRRRLRRMKSKGDDDEPSSGDYRLLGI